MSTYAWKCTACDKTYRPSRQPSTPPACPTCGRSLSPVAPQIPQPKPGLSAARRAQTAPVPKAAKSAAPLAPPPARPSNPFDALAAVASSSSWIPDPEPGPSPSLTPAKHKSRLPAATPADPARPSTASGPGLRLWLPIVGVTTALAGVALFLALRPGPKTADADVVASTPPAATTPATPAAAAPAVNGTLPPAPAAPRTINLLQLVDPARDAVTGAWRFHPDPVSPRLESDATQFARLAIPYAPPAEYDFKVVFARTAGDNCLAQVFTHGGSSAAVILFGWKNTVCGLQHINRSSAEKNHTGVRGIPNANGQTHTSLLRVRQDSVEVYLDGKRIVHHATTGKDLTNQDWKLPTPLGLGTQTSPTLIYTAELTEITGQGTPLR